MLKQDAVFAWDEVANASFQKIKDLIAKSATKPLWYYDRRKPDMRQLSQQHPQRSKSYPRNFPRDPRANQATSQKI